MSICPWTLNFPGAPSLTILQILSAPYKHDINVEEMNVHGKNYQVGNKDLAVKLKRHVWVRRSAIFGGERDDRGVGLKI